MGVRGLRGSFHRPAPTAPAMARSIPRSCRAEGGQQGTHGRWAMDTLSTLQDQLAIRELHARYARASDRRKSEEWALCFTPDGVFVDSNGGTRGGRPTLEAFVRGFHDSL